MIERRKQFNIPEFYAGSILAVTCSDPYAPNKVNRFVGICIKREGYGLRHTFTLRNVVDGLGVEVMYELYNPTVQQIEVLKLEKRLDDDLTYLHDCPPEYSTIPFDMEPFKLPPGSKVPLNDVKVKLNPQPWRHRWERKYLKGAIFPEIARSRHQAFIKSSSDFKPFERYDMMKHYREGINDQDFSEVVKDIKKFEKDTESRREKAVGSRKLKRTRSLPGQE
jgi:large subunit ribosomal protein L19